MKREDSPMQSLHLAEHALYQYEKNTTCFFVKKTAIQMSSGEEIPRLLRCLSEIVAVTLTGSKKFLQSANKRHCPSRPMKNVEVVATGRKQIG